MIGGGAPLRYVYTARGYGSFGSWSPSGYEYSMFSIISGSNPLSRLEVVSLLNIPSQAHELYYYSSTSCPAKYAPKLYLGTLQTIGKDWIIDRNFTSNNWPNSYQASSQKGEANRFNNERFMYFQTLTYIYIFFYNVLIEGKQ